MTYWTHLLRAVLEFAGPRVRVGRVQSSDGRGFSERVAALTRLSCPGFSRRQRGRREERQREERRVKKATSAEWSDISWRCYSITKLILLLGSKGPFIQYGGLQGR